MWWVIWSRAPAGHDPPRPILAAAHSRPSPRLPPSAPQFGVEVKSLTPKPVAKGAKEGSAGWEVEWNTVGATG